MKPQFEEDFRIIDCQTIRKLVLEEIFRLANSLDELVIAARSIGGIFMADLLGQEQVAVRR